MAIERNATVSSKGQIFMPSDVRRLKARVPAPKQPVRLEDMNQTIAARRARAGAR